MTEHRDTSPTLRVSEAAALLGVSACTLRRWCKAGLVTCRRSPGGHRVYDRAELEQVQARRISGPSRPPANDDPSVAQLALLARETARIGDPLELIRIAAVRLQMALDVAAVEVVEVRGGFARSVAQAQRMQPTTSIASASAKRQIDLAVAKTLAEGDLLVLSVAEEPRLPRAEHARRASEGYRCGLVIPLRSGGQALGYIDVADRRRLDLGPSVGVALALGQFVADALQRAQLVEQQHERAGALADMARLSETANEEVTAEELASSVATMLRDVCAATCCEVFRFWAGRLYCLARAGDDDATVALDRRAMDHAVRALAEDAMEAGTPLVVEDLRRSSLAAVSLEPLKRRGYISELFVPLILDGAAVGLIALHDRRPRDYDDCLDFVRSAGEIVVGACSRLALVEGPGASRVEFADLRDNESTLHRSLALDEVLRSIARQACSASDAAICDVYSIEDDPDTGPTSVGVVRYAEGELDADFSGRRFPRVSHYLREPGEAPLAPVEIPDIANDRRVSKSVRTEWQRVGMRSGLSLPLLHHERPVGELLLLDRTPRSFANHALVSGLAQIAASVVANAEEFLAQERLARRLGSMLSASRAVSSALVLEDVLRKVARGAADAIGATDCYIYKYDAKHDTIACMATYHRDGTVTPKEYGVPYPLDDWPRDRLVIETLEPAEDRVHDPQLDPGTRDAMLANGEQSALTVPLAIRGRPLGLLSLVDCTQERRYTSGDIEVVRAVADQAATAIRNARLYQGQQEEARRLASLVEATKAITSPLEIGEVLTTVATRAAQTLGMGECIIYEWDQAADTITTRAYYETGDVFYDTLGQSYPLADYPSDRLVFEGRQTLYELISDPDLLPDSRESMDMFGEKTSLTIPLVSGDEVLGSLVLVESRYDRALTEAEIAFATAFADQAAITIQRARAYDRQQRQNRRLASLLEASRIMTSSVVLQEVLDSVTRAAAQALGSPECFIFELDQAHHTMVWRSAYRLVPDTHAEYGATPSAVGTVSDAWPPGGDDLVPPGAIELGSQSDLRASVAECSGKTCLRVPLRYGGGLLGVLVIVEAHSERHFTDSDTELAQGLAEQAASAIHNAHLYEEMRTMHVANLRGLSLALNAKDYYTLGHAARVSAYMVLLGHELGWSSERLLRVEEASYLHDIGKLAVSDRALLKPGPLNVEEWELIRQHPVTSAEIINHFFDKEYVLAVRHHHESYDGSGYPSGLSGDRIPYLARAMCVVDSYDAMSSRRPYRRTMSYRECLEELTSRRGTQFDGEMVDAFVRVLEGLAHRKNGAEAVAREAALRIDGDAHALLQDRADESRPEYAIIAAALRDVRDSHAGVRFITTQSRTGNRTMFVVDAEEDEAERSRIGDVFLPDLQAAHALAGESADTNAIFVDEYGVWVVGVAPIRDSRGHVVGIVSVDLPAIDLAHAGLRSDISETFATMLRDAAVRSSRAELEAITDGLTGIYNHRHLHERLGEELERARHQQTDVSVLFVDLDNFKRFNDERGHSAGDDALRGVARLLEESTRRLDMVARYGGEEFVVVLVETAAGAAAEVAERIRERLENAELVAGASSLTASIGIATAPADALTKEDLIDRADWAMYIAKRRGRNRVVSYSGVAPAFDQRSELAGEAMPDLGGLIPQANAEQPDVALLSNQTALLAGRLARALAMDEGESWGVSVAAQLRDIGYLGMPDGILQKSEALTADEWRLVHQHPMVGERLLRAFGYSEKVAEAVGQHHEHFDGGGYPRRLRGEQISLAARVVAVAGAYQALCDDDHRSVAGDGALEEIRRLAGTQFDPRVVDALERVADCA